jgi:ligand-binding sensor domain-containing protein/AraC-like DNA-binding protein
MQTEKESPPNFYKLLKTIILLLAVGTSNLLYSSTSNELKKEYEHWVQRSWTTENGLPQNSVYALAQTSDGCLWIGSNGGLARFDGSIFTIFKKNDTLGLASDWITALCPDPDGSLWIGTFGGGLLRQRDGKFSRIEGFVGDRIWSLHLDHEGVLWVVSDEGGLYCLEKRGALAQAIIDDLPDNHVTAVAGSERSILWVGTRGGLAAIRNGRETIFNTRNGLAGNYVYCLFTDSHNNLWAGTTTGLSRINENGIRNFSSADGLADNVVLAIGEDRQGRLWIGTAQGLTIMEPGEKVSCITPCSLGGDAVMAIYRDREDDMWVGTSAGGLEFLKKNDVAIITTEDGLSSQHIQPVCEDFQGRLWVGTADHGLNVLSGGQWRSFSSRDGLASQAITALAAEHNGRLWIGTRESGLQCLDNGTFSSFHKKDGLASDAVQSLFIDHEENLWIGSDGKGLDCFRDGIWQHFGLASGLKGSVILAVNKNRQGSILAGSSQAGLHVLRKGVWRQYTTSDGLAGDTVYSIYIDDKDNVWLGTNGGLSLLRQGIFINFRETSTLLNGIILQILEDDSGYLWMSSPTGIFTVKKSELEYPGQANNKDIHCRQFTEMAGLKSTVCTGGFQPAGCKSRGGQLWFPTMKGLAQIDPEIMRSSPQPPSAWIDKVQANGLSAPLGAPARFAAGPERFDFFYTAVNFADPQQIDFSTRLEGLEDQWGKPEKQQWRHFADLAAGTYSFRVRARGPSGVWKESATRFAFTINPYFHQTAWFYLLVLSSSAAVAAGLFFYRQRLSRRHRLEKYKFSTLNDNKTREYVSRLEQAMEKDKLYLDPDLTLAKLAASTTIPPKHLSQVINERFELNFNDFVNRYRIEEAKRKLLAIKAVDSKLLRIAFEAGFNSKSVFFSTFKKSTGLSPSEFRRLLGSNGTGRGS